MKVTVVITEEGKEPQEFPLDFQRPTKKYGIFAGKVEGKIIATVYVANQLGGV